MPGLPPSERVLGVLVRGEVHRVRGARADADRRDAAVQTSDPRS
jgi:hypothetical protein